MDGKIPLRLERPKAVILRVCNANSDKDFNNQQFNFTNLKSTSKSNYEHSAHFKTVWFVFLLSNKNMDTELIHTKLLTKKLAYFSSKKFDVSNNIQTIFIIYLSFSNQIDISFCKLAKKIK